MITMLVCFQLTQDNPAFIEELKSLGNWSNRMPNSWILEARISPRQVRDLLNARLNPGDRLFVARISQNWAGRGMGEGFPEWLKRREFGTFAAATSSPVKIN